MIPPFDTVVKSPPSGVEIKAQTLAPIASAERLDRYDRADGASSPGRAGQGGGERGGQGEMPGAGRGLHQNLSAGRVRHGLLS
jgi:hypothetical protein